ncbi:glycosyltransferase family 4 protein [Dietzia cinnamea]|uniref:glycosyltransferase n=1 Tax=Dietzia cinnamea TaxID=321318 RepID=UPI00195DB264|nr:glycosyltransferase family 4 protein [Dietzia cinnamea]
MTSNMRVVIFNQFAIPRSEGGITRHVDIFGRLEGIDTTFVAGNRNYSNQQVIVTDDTRFLFVPVVSYSSGAVRRVVSWLQFLFGSMVFFRKIPQVDVSIGSSPQLLAGLAAYLFARRRRVPFVFEVRDIWPESFVALGRLTRRSPLYVALRMLEKFLVRKADHIVVVTDGWFPHFEKIGATSGKYSVVPNGADLSFDIPASERMRVRERLSLSRVTAVFTGSHGPKDGLHEVLDAAVQVPEIDFLLVGHGLQKEELIERARQEGISNVRFLPHVSKDELRDLLGACDVGIHCVAPLELFEKGMSPNKLYDYLAAGLPIVSNAGEGVQNIVQDGVAGAVGGAGSLASGLRRVLNADAEQLEAWRKGGRAIIASRYSIDDASSKYESVLARLVSDSSE